MYKAELNQECFQIAHHFFALSPFTVILMSQAKEETSHDVDSNQTIVQ